MTAKRATPALDTGFRSAEESPGFLLWKVANVLQHKHAQCLAELGVTPTQFSVLTCLVYLQQSEAVTASRIVTHSGMEKMTVSGLLSALETKGYVSRAPNPEDGRSALIRATAKGVRATNAAVRSVEAVDEEFFAALEHRKAFLRELRTLLVSG